MNHGEEARRIGYRAQEPLQGMWSQGRQRSGGGGEVVAFITNPTDAEIEQALSAHNSLRVLLVRATGDFLVWPSAEGLHALSFG